MLEQRGSGGRGPSLNGQIPKLTGQEYLRYWQRRMAQGPGQAGFNGAGAEPQGDLIWQMMLPRIRNLDPYTILDHGCGWGRMLKRMHCLWPEAKITGIDISQEALDGIAAAPGLEDVTLWYGFWPKSPRRYDLVLDCLCLQHLTDPGQFEIATFEIGRRMKDRGHLVLFENIASPNARHVLDMNAEEYMAIWPALKWESPATTIMGGQMHALMIGRRS